MKGGNSHYTWPILIDILRITVLSLIMMVVSGCSWIIAPVEISQLTSGTYSQIQMTQQEALNVIKKYSGRNGGVGFEEHVTVTPQKLSYRCEEFYVNQGKIGMSEVYQYSRGSKVKEYSGEIVWANAPKITAETMKDRLTRQVFYHITLESASSKYLFETLATKNEASRLAVALETMTGQRSLAGEDKSGFLGGVRKAVPEQPVRRNDSVAYVAPPADHIAPATPQENLAKHSSATPANIGSFMGIKYGTSLEEIKKRARVKKEVDNGKVHGLEIEVSSVDDSQVFLFFLDGRFRSASIYNPKMTSYEFPDVWKRAFDTLVKTYGKPLPELDDSEQRELPENLRTQLWGGNEFMVLLAPAREKPRIDIVVKAADGTNVRKHKARTGVTVDVDLFDYCLLKYFGPKDMFKSVMATMDMFDSSPASAADANTPSSTLSAKDQSADTARQPEVSKSNGLPFLDQPVNAFGWKNIRCDSFQIDKGECVIRLLAERPVDQSFLVDSEFITCIKVTDSIGKVHPFTSMGRIDGTTFALNMDSDDFASGGPVWLSLSMQNTAGGDTNRTWGVVTPGGEILISTVQEIAFLKEWYRQNTKVRIDHKIRRLN